MFAPTVWVVMATILVAPPTVRVPPSFYIHISSAICHHSRERGHELRQFITLREKEGKNLITPYLLKREKMSSARAHRETVSSARAHGETVIERERERERE